MNSFLLLVLVAAAIGFFTLLRKLRFQQDNKDTESSSLSPPSSSLSLPSSPTSLPLVWKHDVFPSFHGDDVRKTILSHIMEAFRRKGIDPFIDNDIERTKSIGPELIEAIRGSKIAIIMLSRNYASSSWCLDELAKIMKWRGVLGQKVMTIFYDVDPTDVRKQTGSFGNAFKRTCKGKTKEHIERWRKALEDVAEIAGEHSRNWVNEADMIEKITTDVSNMLINSTLSILRQRNKRTWASVKRKWASVKQSPISSVKQSLRKETLCIKQRLLYNTTLHHLTTKTKRSV